MPLTQAEHPIFWQVTHQPLMVLLLVLGVGAVVAWVVLGNFPPGSAAPTDINFAA